MSLKEIRKTSVALVAVAALAVAVAACTGDDDDDDDAASPSPSPSGTPANNPPAQPACSEGEIRLQGTVNGTSLNLSGMGGGLFMNAGSTTGTIAINLSGTTSATIHVAFESVLPSGGYSAARGSVQTSTLDVGNCESGSFVSGVWAVAHTGTGDEYRFTLRSLRQPPYCTGPAVTGTVGGCWLPQSF